MQFTNSDRLREKAHRLIPGGCHTYAKGDDQFPQLSPGFIARGKGCRVWDVDGNEFIEYGIGCRAVTLGHGYPAVVSAVQDALSIGTNFNRPAEIEVAAAEAFLNVVPRAEMVKFCKNGSDATTAAIKLARAATNREMVAFCSNHPFFSIDDWFIGKTPLDAGIPPSTKKLSATFEYNNLQSVERLFEDHPKQIAALILEPSKYEHPTDRFLHKVRDLCHREGTLFILDEMICGFRLHLEGGQGYYDVTPDLSTFGKALGNGFAISALAGRREYMERGGLFHSQPRVFLLSTTHGAECHSLAAMMATIAVYQQLPVIETLDRLGRRLRDGVNQVIRRHQLERFVAIEGMPSNLVYSTLDNSETRSQAFRSLLLQELIKSNVLAPTLIVSFAHQDSDIDQTVEAFDRALEIYAQALDSSAERFLIGTPSQSPYRKFNMPWQPSTLASAEKGGPVS